MYELSVFNLPQCQLNIDEPIQPLNTSIEDITFVDDESMLADMVAHLKTASELAIDCEVRNYL